MQERHTFLPLWTKALAWTAADIIPLRSFMGSVGFLDRFQWQLIRGSEDVILMFKQILNQKIKLPEKPELLECNGNMQNHKGAVLSCSRIGNYMLIRRDREACTLQRFKAQQSRQVTTERRKKTSLTLMSSFHLGSILCKAVFLVRGFSNDNFRYIKIFQWKNTTTGSKYICWE